MEKFFVLVIVILLAHQHTYAADQECNIDDGWKEFNGKCYYTSPEPASRSWHQAYEYCRQNGGHLTSVHNKEEMDFIIGMTYDVNVDDVWLGGHDFENKNGNFQWADGSSLSWTNWAPMQPDTQKYCMHTNSTTNSLYANSINNGSCSFSREVGVSRVYGVVDNPRNPPNGCVWLGYFPFSSDDTRNADVCEERCAKNHLCDVYTYATTLHESYAWRGECVGCDFITSGDRVSESNVISGEWNCTEENLSEFWYSANCGLQKSFVCSKDKGSYVPLEPTPTVPVPGYCPEGYIDAGRKCFKIINLGNSNGVSWNDARSICQQENGLFPDIATVSSFDENALVVTAMQDYSWGFWIGIFKSGNEWIWVDNADTEFQNWNPARPNMHSCAELLTNPPGTWSDLECTGKRGYVCEVYKDSSNPILTPPSTTPHDCPPEYSPYWYGCYHLDAASRTSYAAEQKCQQDGGHLVSIHTAAEDSAVYHLVVSSGGLFPIWLGLEQNHLGEFIWSDGWTNRYENWNSDHPGNVQSQCVTMDSNGKWNASECFQNHAYVCKTTSAQPFTTPDPVPGVCPEKWFEFGDRCFYISDAEFEANATWNEADLKCQELASQEYYTLLASIHDHSTNEFLAGKLEGRSWIGLHEQGNDICMTREVGTSRIEDVVDNPRSPPPGCLHLGYFNEDGADECKMRCKFHQNCDVYTFMSNSHPAYIWQGECVGCDFATIGQQTPNLHATSGEKYECGEGEYVWSDGTTAEFFRWAPHKPSDENDTNCVEMSSQYQQFPGTWSNRLCSDTLSFICETTKIPPASTTMSTTVSSSSTTLPPPEVGDCPSDEWEMHGHNCYLFKPGESVTWKEAQCACTEYMSHVVSIHDCDENAFVWNRLVINSEPATESRTWVGLYTTESAMNYTWWDGSDMLYNNWAVGHPSMGNEKCVVIDSKDGEWIDLDCDLANGYVCKISKWT